MGQCIKYAMLELNLIKILRLSMLKTEEKKLKSIFSLYSNEKFLPNKNSFYLVLMKLRDNIKYNMHNLIKKLSY